MADLRRRKPDNESDEQISDNGCNKSEQPERAIADKYKSLHDTLKATDSTDHVYVIKFSFFFS